MLKLISLFFLMLALSCDNNKSAKYNQENVIEEPSYSFVIPDKWKLVKTTGIDSSTGYLLTDSCDSIYYDFGVYSENITANLLKVLPLSDKDYSSIDDEKTIFRYSSTPYIDQDLGIFLKEFYVQDTIDNVIIKTQIPKSVGEGFTGLYTENINKDGKRLVIRGENLNQENQEKLLQLFKTIRFK